MLRIYELMYSYCIVGHSKKNKQFRIQKILNAWYCVRRRIRILIPNPKLWYTLLILNWATSIGADDIYFICFIENMLQKRRPSIIPRRVLKLVTGYYYVKSLLVKSFRYQHISCISILISTFWEN